MKVEGVELRCNAYRCPSAELSYLISGIKEYWIIGIFFLLRIVYIENAIGLSVLVRWLHYFESRKGDR